MGELRDDLPLPKSWAISVLSGFSHVLGTIFVPFAILLVETSRRRMTSIAVAAGVEGRSIFADSPYGHFSGPMQSCRPVLARSHDGLPRPDPPSQH